MTPLDEQQKGRPRLSIQAGVAAITAQQDAALAEYVRITGKTTLQTAVHHYLHPDTGRKGDAGRHDALRRPRYFTRLYELISECEAAGAVVHCEGSGRVPIDDSDITVDEELLLCDRRRCGELEMVRLPMVGWAYQSAWLVPGPQWQVHDLSDLDIIRLARLPVIAKMIARKQRILGPSGRIALKRLRFVLAITMGVMASPAVQRRRLPGDDVLVDHRNTVALKAFNATGRDTVLVGRQTHPWPRHRCPAGGTDAHGHRLAHRHRDTGPVEHPEQTPGAGRAPAGARAHPVGSEPMVSDTDAACIWPAEAIPTRRRRTLPKAGLVRNPHGRPAPMIDRRPQGTPS
jgi:hypothetical protein